VKSGSAFDLAVVGGGIMGCTLALHAARAGMRVVLFERGRLCGEASSRNAGGLTMSDKGPELLPYALRGRALRETAPEWQAVDTGYRQTGGLLLAFTDEEAEGLETTARLRRDAGAPVELISAARARQIEPGLSSAVKLATYCALDGFADSTLTGLVFRTALRDAGVHVREPVEVRRVERKGSGFVVITEGDELVSANRIALAGGVWLPAMARWFGIELPIVCDIKQQIVTERMPPIIRTIIRAANRRLSLKQTRSGALVMGGGWSGVGSFDENRFELLAENIVGHLRMAHMAIPAVAGARVARTWIGLEAVISDRKPVAGPLTGVENAFIIGAVWGGYTIGPFMARLLGDLILGREPELPLYDPARLYPQSSPDRRHQPPLQSAAAQ
jgi:sarcosine oxidase subunit beta